MMRRVAVFIFAVCLGVFTLSAAVAADKASPAVDSARAKVVAGDPAGAIRDLEGYVPGHPDDVGAGRLLGDLYFRIPDYKKAEAVWKNIIARVATDRDTHNRLGSLYSAQDRIREAIDEYDKSLPSRGGFNGLIEQNRKQGTLAAFEARVQEQAESHPLDAGALSFWANILRAEHKYTQAQPFFMRVLALNPQNCGALIDAGNNYIDIGKSDLAIGLLEKCLKMEPKNYTALVDAGEAYIDKNNYGKARTYIESALAANREGPEALIDLGFIEDTFGHWKEAVAYYLRAMAADPLQAAAYIDLGYDYNEQKLYKLAEAAFIKGISIAPDDGRLHYMLGVTYNLQGKIALAREQYRLAVASQEPVVVKAAQAELALLPPAQ
ncbi:MAG: tetratricopeptide repeat protein [Candidatus Velthaea sp.]